MPVMLLSLLMNRWVIGGLVAATLATLFVLPSIFALVQGWTGRRSASLDPDDPESRYYSQSAPVSANGTPPGHERIHEHHA